MENAMHQKAEGRKQKEAGSVCGSLQLEEVMHNRLDPGRVEGIFFHILKLLSRDPTTSWSSGGHSPTHQFR